MTDAAITLPAHAPALPGMRIPAHVTTRALGALSDRRLAEMAASGAGEQPFAAIYARYHQPLYRYCHSIARDPDDAADALQSAMLKAYLALPAKRAEVDLKPWLFRIAHNEAISVIRRRARHDEITDANSPHVASAHEEAAAHARLDQLVDDLQELDERQRAAVVMRELSGLTYDEIGAAFGTSAASAKQAVYEARIALHERAEGRAMSCEPVRRAVSDGDGRKLRARKLRAHLRACAGCREFERALGRRRTDLAALAPPLPAPAAAALLKAVIGTGSVGDAGLGTVAANTAALKTLAAVITVAAGAGTAGMVLPRGSSDTSVAQPPPAAVVAAQRPQPLTSLYVLSGGHMRAAHLRAPARLLAEAPAQPRRPSPDAAPTAPARPETVAVNTSQQQTPRPPSAPAPGVPVPRLPQLAVPPVRVDPISTIAPALPTASSSPAVSLPVAPVPELPALPLP